MKYGEWLERVLTDDIDEAKKRALITLYPLLRSGRAKIVDADEAAILAARHPEAQIVVFLDED